jgi:DNA helicase-2/ATP-dependent DNA helicase PcrA
VPTALDLNSLNPAQLEAVNHPGGPLLVFAGAGSGKTRVITYRIARLIHDAIPPYRILAVTFTNKAANEMRERVSVLLAERARGLWVGTFHATCGRILRESGERIGVDRSFVVYDDADQIAVVRDCLKELNIDDKQFAPRGVLSAISRAKERLISPEQYAEMHHNYYERVVGSIYPVYQRRLRAANGLDFDDLICYAVRLLRERSDVLESYQRRFQHVLVDEYQDVNHAQYVLVGLLAGKHRNVTVVGDDDQSIYGWRGADVALILRFSSDYPDAKVVTLEENYRSTQRILDAAHQVVRNNRSRAQKKLWTKNSEGTPVTVTLCGTEHDEAQLVANTIRNDAGVAKRQYRDFAVLYRTNAQSRVFEEVFLSQRIPHQIVGAIRFYERREIKDVVAYLRLLANPQDTVSLRRIINVPHRGIGATTLAVLEEGSAELGISRWDAMNDAGILDRLSRRPRKRIDEFRGLIERLRGLPLAGPVTPVLEAVLDATGYVRALEVEHTVEAEDRIENVRELLTATSEYDAAAEEPNLIELLQNIALVSDADTVGEKANSVVLMTLHTAKGLEFPVVFITGLEEGVFPHQRSMESDAEIEEERRLCYVGMTRAQEELNLTFASRRSFRGQAQFNPPSRFLSHLDHGKLTSLGSSVPPAASGARPGKARIPPVHVPATPHTIDQEFIPPFGVGERVRHKKFGIGVVVSCAKVGDDCEVTVAFPGIVGIKKLLQRYAQLESLRD